MENDILNYEQRADKILEILRSQNSVSVNYLSEQLNVSGTTIRTDLTKMESSGIVVRTHGGAMLKTSLYREQAMTERLHDDKKMLIAAKALSHIENHDTLLIDTGTTMLFLARAIARSSLTKLRIFTNDLEVVRTLEVREDFEVNLLGGKIRNRFHYCYGNSLIQSLQNYNFEKLFLSASAISISHGLTVSTDELAQIKTAMIQSSHQIFLLADSSKVNHIDFRKFADLQEVDVLIMDQELSPSYQEKLQDMISCIELV